MQQVVEARAFGIGLWLHSYTNKCNCGVKPSERGLFLEIATRQTSRARCGSYAHNVADNLTNVSFVDGLPRFLVSRQNSI